MPYAGKTSYKYPAWVTEGRPPPPQTQDELRLARIAAARAYEEHRATKKRSHPRPGREIDPGRAIRPIAGDEGVVGFPRSVPRDLAERLVRSRGEK